MFWNACIFQERQVNAKTPFMEKELFEWNGCPLPGIRGMWSLNTHLMTSHLNNFTFLKHSPLLQSAHSILDNQPPLGRSYPRLVWTLNQWMTICSSFIDQLIRFEMIEAFVSAIQIVISLDSPFDLERKCFSKITQIYNLAHKLLRLRSKHSKWRRKAFISLPSRLQRNIPC